MKQKKDLLGLKIVGVLKETPTPWAVLIDLFRHLGLQTAEKGVQGTPC